jgi:hypothetical protein
MADLYYGLDTAVWPEAGLDVFKWIISNTPVSIAGFYLGPAPSHGEGSFMPHQEDLTALGYGLVPIYVGQQITGPGSHVMTAAQGTIDGANAAALMQAAGFAEGSCVYFDHEEGAPLENSRIEYDAALLQAVADGGYTACIYCSHTMGNAVFMQLSPANLWCFDVPTVAASLWSSPTPPAPRTTITEGTGVANASGWQYKDNTVWQPAGLPGKRLRVDFSVWSVPDPSAAPTSS